MKDKVYKCTATYSADTILLGYTKHPKIMKQYYTENGHKESALSFTIMNKQIK
mgnify:FL=1